MCQKLPYWASVLFSAVALVLLIVNISFANANRAKQIDISQRQATIQSGQTLAQFSQGLIQAIAEASLKNNDLQLRDLLTAQGITLKADAKPAEKK